ncbi:hypothetical protein NMG60_11031277 [Bertholletia excelsa]
MDSAQANKNRDNKTKKRKKASFISKFGCFRSDFGVPTVETIAGDGNFDMESAFADANRRPTHLVVTVNGIIGCAENWRYAAKQLLKKYPQDVIVHCSESNSSTLTFQGVDKMGSRLADEVVSVIKRYPGLQNISFIGHSLGGLIARFAIAKLYSEGDGECRRDEFKGRIAGLEPMNFITSATPHLGSRGHKQAPAFCGSYTLEKAAARASWLLGRSGKHLFLKDGNKKKPPLLLKMASDSDDLKFISALQSFRRRVAYSNARFDFLVGWSTSSLRHRSELPKRKTLSRSDKYPHVINVEYAKAADTREETCLDPKVNRFKTTDVEEAMIRGLTKMSWEKVDVDFGGSKQRFWAHNTIQVNSYRMNSDGADVIQHMVDNFLV